MYNSADPLQRRIFAAKNAIFCFCAVNKNIVGFMINISPSFSPQAQKFCPPPPKGRKISSPANFLTQSLKTHGPYDHKYAAYSFT